MKGEEALLKATPPNSHGSLVTGDGSDWPPIRKSAGISVSGELVAAACFKEYMFAESDGVSEQCGWGFYSKHLCKVSKADSLWRLQSVGQV